MCTMTITLSPPPKVQFVVGPRLQLPTPPTKPPDLLGLGTPCFKATCFLHDPKGKPIGKFVGYLPSVDICQVTEKRCKTKLDDLDGDYSCSIASLSMLKASNQACAGNYYFDLDA